MFSSTLKRSVTTLGVVAGLLAAAGPASAACTQMANAAYDKSGPGTQVGSEGLKAGSNEILIDLDAAVTVKAPKPSDARP